MKKQNTYQKIRLAMKEREKSVLSYLRRVNKENRGGEMWRLGLTEMKALKRLEEKGKVKFKKSTRTRTSGYYAI